MIKFLDFAIFGSGYGLAAPYWSQKFYWLVDRRTEKGTFYTWFGGMGAQLESFQWTHPKPGERRSICGYDFHPFQSNRRWGRVRVSWARCRDFKDFEEIRQFELTLGGGR